MLFQVKDVVFVMRYVSGSYLLVPDGKRNYKQDVEELHQGQKETL